MPYIPQVRRIAVQPRPRYNANTAGELNFQISDLIGSYLTANGLSYQTINDCLGALDGAGKEFYARVARPYEDKKIELNGDVYPQTLLGDLEKEN